MAAKEIGGEIVILSKIEGGNEMRKFAKIVVAEEIGQGNEIIVSKNGLRNELRKLLLGQN